MGASHPPSSPSSESWVLFLYDHRMWVSLQFGDVVGCWGSSLALPSTKVRQDEREVEVAPSVSSGTPAVFFHRLPHRRTCYSPSFPTKHSGPFSFSSPHGVCWLIRTSRWIWVFYRNHVVFFPLETRNRVSALCIWVYFFFLFQEGTWVVWQERAWQFY